MVYQQWAILPVRRQTSIVASAELNFCVRNGNRWTLCDKNTDFSADGSLRLYKPSACASGMVHLRGLEPRTHWLRVSCSTSWARGADPGLCAMNFSLSTYVHRKSNKGQGLESSETHNYRILNIEVQALGLLVSVSWTHYCAYTSDLSNS